MRLFLAINIPDKIKNDIASVQNGLKTSRSDIKWVEKNNFHITLKFLGEVDEAKSEQLLTALTTTPLNSKQFNISFYGLGVFPNIHSPRVIWVGLKDGEIQIKNLAQEVENTLSNIGFEKEKREFSAHLTIGRVRSFKNDQALIKKIISSEKIEFAPFNVISIDIMQSFLHSSGPEYKCLKSISI